MKIFVTSSLIVGLAFVLTGCSDDPSFLNMADDRPEAAAPATDEDKKVDDAADEKSADQKEKDATDEKMTDGTKTVYTIPGTSEAENAALHKCMALWGQVPFGETVKNYRKITASISVGGSGTVINDQTRTAEPYLILIVAGVNVNSNIEYNLLNPNGYYCMMANVNVNTNLDVNLHCHARLADSTLSVNVNSSVNGDTSGYGVHVNSNVEVKSVEPHGDACLR